MMRVLVVLAKNNQIFESSFLEAAAAKGFSLAMFYIDESRNLPMSFWREEVRRTIREQAIEKLLMINDCGLDGDYLVDDGIFTMVPSNVWFVDPLQSDAYVTAGHLSGYRRIFTYEPTDVPYCLQKFGLIANYLPFPAGDSLFVPTPGILRKKRNMILALWVILARIRGDYRSWMQRRGFAGSGIIPWPYTGNSGMTVIGWCLRRAR